MGHLSTSCVLSFKPSNILEIKLDHTLPLYIIVMVFDFIVKSVMIYNGSSLNLCTLRFIKQVGYTEANIINEVITIKSYEKLERTTKGTLLFPIRFSPDTQEALFHVVDLNLPFNILLGWPWIHAMKDISSTYHQCIKFLHHGIEITIYANPKPFLYCNMVEKFYIITT